MTRTLAVVGALTLTGTALILAAAWDRERRLDRAAGVPCHRRYDAARRRETGRRTMPGGR